MEPEAWTLPTEGASDALGLADAVLSDKSTRFPHSVLASRLPHYEHGHIQDGCGTPNT